MRSLVKYLFSAIAVLCACICYAQDPPKEKTPEEVAAMEVEMLERELELNAEQAFYVDSILQHNYRGLKTEFENMQKSGMQDGRNYEKVREKWINKNLEAFKKVLTEQQYIMYLKRLGKGKEYKRGKDGLYYKKEATKKEKKGKANKEEKEA